MDRLGELIEIPVAMMEFVIGGNTIWIIDSNGGTVLRLQTPPGSRISVNEECENICSHADVRSKGDITICLKEGDNA